MSHLAAVEQQPDYAHEADWVPHADELLHIEAEAALLHERLAVLRERHRAITEALGMSEQVAA